MPKPHRTPSYRLHKPSGRAVVRLDGKDHYLGAHGSPESRQLYEELVGRWLSRRADAARRPSATPAKHSVTVNELFLAFWAYALTYYVKNGRPTGEISNLRESLKPLAALYGTSRIESFGPLDLKAVRQNMVDAGLCRKVVNSRVNRIRRMFKWGVENELVPPSVLQALQAVAPLKQGRCNVREAPPVLPVCDADIDQTLAHAPAAIAAMIRLQRRTGMRPGEVVIMRGIDIDTTGETWIYRPESHKTEHFGKQKLIYLGPQAQRVVAAHLKSDPHAYLFSPVDVMAERQAQRRSDRKTPMTPSQRKRKPKKRPRRTPKARYTTQSYGQAIVAACDLAFPLPAELARHEAKGRRGSKLEAEADWRRRVGEEGWERIAQWRRDHRWAPNQLRHTAATQIRKEFGLEAARVILGHSSPTVTEIYAERDQAKAQEIMRRVG